ncbi:ABC-type spermidine/putrescine transport system, ATPase component [Mycolicibacterium canariasense]|uniref:ABC-type quaternary amine transporter n=1 Tax=Mycolicibacterium canariasense TaxID=228230 RepID=A0A100WJK4_MYCCR|nr:ABC transporter ATP-binding protein [Mycolicibacterium canariasense]MCV7207579.1 ABC transporter ATP-binding protein [Mycolicibacterium canariasense]ORV08808.1 phosphonate ABC transporter ATP-binding protein [Mycolicibacterium canariasense]GAS99689.1 ABC-type spermidine/putrescine transport system, ATPase component [Mycolicibacterium canariasense]
MAQIKAAGRHTTRASETAVPAIVFDRVGVRYGRGSDAAHALIDFNLRVAPGETVALLGPSGSGKSTALGALAGFVRPSSGAVRLDGRDITDLPPAKRGIGVVLQSYALFPHMRVADNVAFGLRAQRVPRAQIADRVTEVLEMVGMAGYGKRLPRELSGGQQQRVAIARALAIRPRVLLLDEPLAALDAQLRQSMLAELQQLKESLPDTAMLYVTHDQSEALALADRIVVMNNARLMDVDTAENLWRRPPTSFTAAFLGGANLIPCTVGRVIGTSALVTVSHKTVSAEAPQPAAGRIDWAPGTEALLCIRPHALRVVSLGERDALRATVNAVVWRGAVTRLVLAITSMPDQLIEIDVPGHARFQVGSEVGVRIPEPAGVLVQAGS